MALRLWGVIPHADPTILFFLPDRNSRWEGRQALAMVFYFICSDPRYTIYMGRDKYENEHLIQYGWPEDLWFHVDKVRRCGSCD